MNTNIKQLNGSRGGKKASLTVCSQGKKPLLTNRTARPDIGHAEDELNKLRTAAAAVQQLRLTAQRELQIAKQLRMEAQRYQQETETIARSQAQQLILKTRLSTQKEVEELIRKSSAEIQKVLADIRVIRITAQEELAAQRKFTDAARIFSLSAPGPEIEPEVNRKKQLVATR